MEFTTPWEGLFLGNGIARTTSSALLKLAILLGALPAYADATLPVVQHTELARQLQVGDLVFIRVSAMPFRKVAATTGSWTNHVGIVVATDGPEPTIAESTFPLSKQGSLKRFLARSENGRVEVSRLNTPLTANQQHAIVQASQRRMGIFYDTGFDLHSRRQFCSRFVHEVLQEAAGVDVGEVETFATLLTKNPETSLSFWRVWYFGNIPWQRETVTPASVLQSAKLHPIFNGYMQPEQSRA